MKLKNININKKLTYISLFSSAGIGCFGFKKADFDCIATVEILDKRLQIQRSNNKCKFDSGYINFDITNDLAIQKIKNEIKKFDVKDVDVIIATPPCQGISVANQKKKNELGRNSLVTRAIEIINIINPKIFVFENVKNFLKTICKGLDGIERTISDEIEIELSKKYSYASKVINFKNYGSNSSRTRTLVIGVRKDLLNTIVPYELFPDFSNEKTLKEIIGKFPSLNKMGEFDKNNVLHSFKSYDPKYLKWISNLKEGESAFNNKKKENRPHKIINGEIVELVKVFGDKYKRQTWNKVAPCIHTANDCLASQNTIHPSDNRVFSIAELMELMTIPNDFKWDSIDYNKLSYKEKHNWLLKNQGNIRKCIGEAVPTNIFYQIATKISKILSNNDIYNDLKKFELNNQLKIENAAYYTDKLLLSEIYNILPDFNKDEISILEPSVGAGNFLIPIFNKYQDKKIVNLTIVDIDKKSIDFIKDTFKSIIPKNFNITYIVNNFLNIDEENKYDLIIGNPPFKKSGKIDFVEQFWYKSLKMSKNIMFINQKFVLLSPKYANLREQLENSNINKILDFGELGFKGVKIETIMISISEKNNKKIFIKSLPKNKKIYQDKKYIFDKKFDYWIIYRDNEFDRVWEKMTFDIFSINKNYEISNSVLEKEQTNSNIRVIRSKNISINSLDIVNIKNYDRYIELEKIKNKNYLQEILNDDKLYLIPTLTYYPRVIKKPNNTLVNGSVLLAKIKDKNINISNKDLLFYLSDEYRYFYNVAFNFSTRTLNIDKYTVKFFGILKK